jgi:hypothetical protein
MLPASGQPLTYWDLGTLLLAEQALLLGLVPGQTPLLEWVEVQAGQRQGHTGGHTPPVLGHTLVAMGHHTLHRLGHTLSKGQAPQDMCLTEQV